MHLFLKTMLFTVLLLLSATISSAIPLGFTQISDKPNDDAVLTVIDGIAYGSKAFIKGEDGNVYYPRLYSTYNEDWVEVHNYGVFNIDQPGVPVVNTPIIYNNSVELQHGFLSIYGMDENFNIYATVKNYRDQYRTPYHTFPVYKITPENKIEEIVVEGAWELIDIEPNGYMIGTGYIPGTIGSGSFLVAPDGSSILAGGGASGNNAATRRDGNGINLAINYPAFTVTYGDGRRVEVQSPDGQYPHSIEDVYASENDFVVFTTRDYVNGEIYYEDFAYFPGINPTSEDWSVSLEEYFPELQNLDYDRVVDIASSEGRLHLLLSGEDGLWIYAANDPTFVPEPSSAALGSMVLLSMLFSNKRRFRQD